MKRKNKKGIAKSTMGFIILTVLSLSVAVTIIAKPLTRTDEEGLLAACQFDVARRASLKAGRTSIGGFNCHTIYKEIGTKGKDTKEFVMRDLANLALRTWQVFGEGVLHTMKDNIATSLMSRMGGLFYGGFDAAFCFPLFDVQIRDIKDGPITWEEFSYFLDHTVYKISPLQREISCNDGINNNPEVNNLVDCVPGREDPDCDCDACKNNPRACRMKKELFVPCVFSGGQCKEACDQDTEFEIFQTGWECNDKQKVCCVERNGNIDVYSYNDYLNYHSGVPGTITHPDILTDNQQIFQFVKGKRYAIAYVEPLLEKKPGFILIGDFNQITDVCTAKIPEK